MVASETAVDAGPILHALQESWDAATSADSAWSAEVPSRGQCAVSALVIQDELGGVLVRTMIDGVSHYWNRLADGTEIDATRDQFTRWCPGEQVIRERAHVLSFPDTRRRYAILRKRVDYRLRSAG